MESFGKEDLEEMSFDIEHVAAHGAKIPGKSSSNCSVLPELPGEIVTIGSTLTWTLQHHFRSTPRNGRESRTPTLTSPEIIYSENGEEQKNCRIIPRNKTSEFPDDSSKKDKISFEIRD
ncbi:Hypothetical predicted protein [Octopus vulgaris]|uniref:Uncharacterized protein n=1 Tax=Octopus vulgaris TaxID=6645 RepID=A0AA36F9P9_OCTVU|nr:Hypothetical predicted protein [Octopus vulgaris]